MDGFIEGFNAPPSLLSSGDYQALAKKQFNKGGKEILHTGTQKEVAGVVSTCKKLNPDKDVKTFKVNTFNCVNDIYTKDKNNKSLLASKNIAFSGSILNCKKTDKSVCLNNLTATFNNIIP